MGARPPATEPGRHAGGFRDTGASRTGLGAWWWQRLSALYLGGFLTVALAWLALDPPAGYAQWRIWLALDGVRLALVLFVAAVGIHAYIGVRDVAMDYLPEGVVRVALLAVWLLAVAGLVAWGGLWAADLGGGP
ncbi:MAG TPA: succinate dehydrogenase, hydrophobic membrane anchor protein [Gammaproteobacteria bacterium]|nr:succinate dehydrogenase, hydrophobic membrane anchor protein [Gammaproteobacteria bacterium]